MTIDELTQLGRDTLYKAQETFSQPETYVQIGIILAIYLVAWVLANRIRKYAPFLDVIQEKPATHPWRKFIAKVGGLIFSLLAILMLRIAVEVSTGALTQSWLMQTALTVAILLLFYSIIQNFVKSPVAAEIFKWLGMPLLFLHLLGILSGLIAILESISVNIGNIEISIYGIARVAIFGSLLFWLGRVSSKTGRSFIPHQERLDIRTREVAAKLFRWQYSS
jgi:hypothetical protein